MQILILHQKLHQIFCKCNLFLYIISHYPFATTCQHAISNAKLSESYHCEDRSQSQMPQTLYCIIPPILYVYASKAHVSSTKATVRCSSCLLRAFAPLFTKMTMTAQRSGVGIRAAQRKARRSALTSSPLP